VIILWFATIGLLGAIEIARHPGILRALDPRYCDRADPRRSRDGLRAARRRGLWQ